MYSRTLSAVMMRGDDMDHPLFITPHISTVFQFNFGYKPVSPHPQIPTWQPPPMMLARL
jgi:hypothetical protein